VASLIKGGSLR